MESQTDVSLLDQVSFIVHDVAKAVSCRTGESVSEQHFRYLVASHSVLAFQPRDSIEARLAGSCVIFHELIVDTARTTLSGEAEPKRRGTRNSIVAMDKRFGNNHLLLNHYQIRQPANAPKDQPAAAQPAEIHTETEIADRVRRHQSKPPAGVPASSGPPEAKPVPSFTSPESHAECLANPEAMAALDAGDPAGFANAMGIDNPRADYLRAASSQMASLNRQAAAARRPNGTGGMAQPGGQTRGQTRGQTMAQPGAKAVAASGQPVPHQQQ